MGLSDSLGGVEISLVEDPGSSPQFPLKLLSNT